MNKHADATRGEEELALARRLDEAAANSGLSNEEIGEKMEVTGANVSHWRRGRHSPSVAQVRRFAFATGASEVYLLTGKIDEGALLRAYEAALSEWEGAVRRGEDAAAAWERILGRVDLFDPLTRARLSEASADLERYLAAGGGADWVRLSVEERRCVQQLIRLLARRPAG